MTFYPSNNIRTNHGDSIPRESGGRSYCLT
jgi:hypothetical protein